MVNAAGMWARQFGALAGVSVPLQAAEHYYLLTDTVPGMDPDLPVIEDPDNYGYYRPEGDGMLVGLFEPVGAPWSLDGVPRDFSFGKLARTGTGWSRSSARRWPGSRAGRDRRAHVLLRAGVVHRRRPAAARARARAGRLLRRRRPQLARHPVRRRRRQRGRAVDRGRRAAGRHDAHIAIDRTALRDAPGGSARSGPWSSSACCSATRSGRRGSRRPARNIRRSVLHDRLAAAGAHFATSAGWEFAEWFEPAGEHRRPRLGFGRPASHDIVAASTPRCARRSACST